MKGFKVRKKGQNGLVWNWILVNINSKLDETLISIFIKQYISEWDINLFEPKKVKSMRCGVVFEWQALLANSDYFTRKFLLQDKYFYCQGNKR